METRPAAHTCAAGGGLTSSSRPRARPPGLPVAPKPHGDGPVGAHLGDGHVGTARPEADTPAQPAAHVVRQVGAGGERAAAGGAPEEGPQGQEVAGAASRGRRVWEQRHLLSLPRVPGARERAGGARARVRSPHVFSPAPVAAPRAAAPASCAPLHTPRLRTLAHQSALCCAPHDACSPSLPLLTRRVRAPAAAPGAPALRRPPAPRASPALLARRRPRRRTARCAGSSSTSSKAARTASRSSASTWTPRRARTRAHARSCARSTRRGALQPFPPPPSGPHSKSRRRSKGIWATSSSAKSWTRTTPCGATRRRRAPAPHRPAYICAA